MALTGIRLVTAAAAFAAMTGAAQAGIGIAFTTDNGRNLSDAQAEQVLDGMFEAYANNNVSGSGNRCSSAFVRALQAIPGVLTALHVLLLMVLQLHTLVIQVLTQ